MSTTAEKLSAGLDSFSFDPQNVIEDAIERYFCDGVKRAGGEVRKVQWIGRRHCMDRRVSHPALCCFVELKRPGKEPRPGQEREIERLRKLGETIFVVSTYAEADEFLARLK